MSAPWSLTSSTTLACGTAKTSPQQVTTSAGTMARVSGMASRTTVPAPGSDEISSEPRICLMLEATTSIPTPRPEILVTSAAVEKPGSRISSTISDSVISATWAVVTNRFSTADAATFWGSMPRPSSLTSMMTWPPSCTAESRMVPTGSLPSSARSSLGSSPWSTALRTRWTSGSRMDSMMVRSSSMPSPVISTWARLPAALDTSRTTRGSDRQAVSIRCMRVRSACSCRAEVM